MKYIAIAVRDDKTEAFGTPQFVRTKAEAIRMLQNAVNKAQEDNMLYMHPGDFTLYALAEYDDDRGAIKGYEVPDLIAHLKDLKDDSGKTPQRP